MENTFGMDPGKLASEVAKISWYHTFNFGNGIVTSVNDDSYICKCVPTSAVRP